MKKVIVFTLCVAILLFCCACGKNAQTSSKEEAQQATAGATQNETNAENKANDPSSSENKAVVTEENAPSVYWKMDTYYHLENCSELKGAEYSAVNWIIVKEIGLRKCPHCNPPLYEGYVEDNQ